MVDLSIVRDKIILPKKFKQQIAFFLNPGNMYKGSLVPQEQYVIEMKLVPKRFASLKRIKMLYSLKERYFGKIGTGIVDIQVNP